MERRKDAYQLRQEILERIIKVRELTGFTTTGILSDIRIDVEEFEHEEERDVAHDARRAAARAAKKLVESEPVCDNCDKRGSDCACKNPVFSGRER